MQAVAEQIVHLVDVDRPGEHARRIREAVSRGFAQRATTSRGWTFQLCRSTSPISPSRKKSLANNSWLGTPGNSMSSMGWQNGQWPRLCSNAAARKYLGVLGADGGLEPLVVGQPLQISSPRRKTPRLCSKRV